MHSTVKTGVVLCLLLCASLLPAQYGSLAGDYVCKSVRGNPCSTGHSIRLLADGGWAFDWYRGTYSVAGGKITFMPKDSYIHAWGTAIVGPGTITFNDFGDNAIWVKPSDLSGVLAPGNYYCQTAPHGCLTRTPIQIQANGAFSWGAIKSSYSILGNQVRFGGLSEGPAGWGLANIGNGNISFRASDGSMSVWALTSGNPYASQYCDPRLPDYQQKGCTPRPR
jgi:hypothetical protein